MGSCKHEAGGGGGGGGQGRYGMETLVSKAYIVVPVCLVSAGTYFDDGVSLKHGAGDGEFPDGVLAVHLRVGGGGGVPLAEF